MINSNENQVDRGARLQFATGTLLTIYDAEDIPEPEQLQQAAAVFTQSGSDLACVQARLVIDNGQTNWLTRQFAAEYAALFDLFLPALAAARLPILLGGTSNHFRTKCLRQVGGWDAYNVTEDADLGMRLARHGYRVGVITSKTCEEAPTRLKDWLGQRRRWMKGFLQSAMVHGLTPIQAGRGWGLVGVMGVCGTLLASLLAAFLYPIALFMLIFTGVFGLTAQTPQTLDLVIFAIGVAAFAGGHLLPLMLLILAARKNQQSLSLFTVLSTGGYWLLISFAAYWAVIDLIRTPYAWVKTHHKGRGLINTRE